jgi:hypothetical protein
MKIVGPRIGHSEFELNPQEAYRRGRAMDAMLRSAGLKHPRGVTRGTFADFARLEAARAIEIARRLNST